MAYRLRPNSAIRTQIRVLGQLAAKLDSDPRHPIDVFDQFFRFTPDERETFMQGYEDREDPQEVYR